MRTIKLLFYILVITTISSCSDEEPIPPFSGNVSITLINNGATQVIEGEAKEITYDVVLSKSFDKDITLTFNLEGLSYYPNLLSISKVLIKKNQTKGKLTITSSKKSNFENVLNKDVKLTIKLKSYEGIKNKMYLTKNHIIIVKQEEGVIPLTDAQKQLINHYKSKGIDISMWIGKIPVETTVITGAGGSTVAFENSETKTYKGFTYITLSKHATKEKPLLVMTKNAFGLSEYLQYVFRHETILDKVYWNENPAPKEVLKALGDKRVNKWKNKEYSFDVAVDNIEFKANNSITFVSENSTFSRYNNFFDDPNLKRDLSAVDFQYKFPLWDELVELAKNNNSLKEHIVQGGSVHPNNYIGASTILEDDWGENNFVQPKGTFNNTEMNFKFNTDHNYSGDYDIVTVKYKLPKN